MRRLLLALFLFGLSLSLAAADLKNGVTSCPASGNAPVVTVGVKVSWYIIQAPLANTGNVTVGGSTVTTANSVILPPGYSLNSPPQGNTQPFDLSHIYIACTITGDQIRYVYTQ